jgi:electron transfer flavoprotein alpha subunit
MSILVFTENRNGKIKKHTFEALSYANEIAKNINSKVYAISIGDLAQDELNKLAQFGAETIFNIQAEQWKYLDNQAYSRLVDEIVKKEQITYIIFSNSILGKAVAPRVAVRLKAAMLAGVVNIPSSYEPFTVKRRTYNGSAFLNATAQTEIKVLTINPNSCDIAQNQLPLNTVDYQPQTDVSIMKTTVKNVDIVTGKIILTEADIVVSGGRGMKSGENWKYLEELADLLGAGLACSRPVSDEGWRPHEEHVGQTGKIIAPELYIAVGISGAIQHIGGVSSSKVMVAIDKDKDAPIFSYTTYGIVGDAFQILPRLIESIKKFKQA